MSTTGTQTGVGQAEHKVTRRMTGLERAISKALNGIVGLVLRSPIHRLLSGDVMLVAFKGRKSGKHYTTPVTYIRDSNSLVLFTTGNWWVNFESGAGAMVRVAGRELQGYAQAITDPEKIISGVSAYLQEKGVDKAWMLGLKLDKSHFPTHDELAFATRNRVMVRIDTMPSDARRKR